jgi:hypothetical protein
MNVCIEYRSKKGVGGYVNGHFATLVMDGKYIDSRAQATHSGTDADAALAEVQGERTEADAFAEVEAH